MIDISDPYTVGYGISVLVLVFFAILGRIVSRNNNAFSVSAGILISYSLMSLLMHFLVTYRSSIPVIGSYLEENPYMVFILGVSMLFIMTWFIMVLVRTGRNLKTKKKKQTKKKQTKKKQTKKKQTKK